jgi:Domain of unknown function (DUF6089)
MKRFIVLLFIGFLSNINAQIHEVGVFLGGSNYVGDIGPTTYINPNETAFGLLYKWNKSQRHSWRFSYTKTKLAADDKNSDSKARKQRNLSFENSFHEISAGLEFNFLKFNQHNFDKIWTPYVYSGLSYTRYDGLYFEDLNYPKKNDTQSAIAIPMIVGLKTKFLNNWVFGAEVGARYSFKDDIDGSNPKDDKLANLRFGNINSNDWYVFSGFTITYTFGEKPCYCKD